MEPPFVQPEHSDLDLERGSNRRRDLISSVPIAWKPSPSPLPCLPAPLLPCLSRHWLFPVLSTAALNLHCFFHHLPCPFPTSLFSTSLLPCLSSFLSIPPLLCPAPWLSSSFHITSAPDVCTTLWEGRIIVFLQRRNLVGIISKRL